MLYKRKDPVNPRNFRPITGAGGSEPWHHPRNLMNPALCFSGAQSAGRECREERQNSNTQECQAHLNKQCHVHGDDKNHDETDLCNNAQQHQRRYNMGGVPCAVRKVGCSPPPGVR